MQIAILGHFGFGQTLTNGQTIKTKMLSEGMKGIRGISVSEIDTKGWKKHPLRLYKNIKRAFQNSDCVIMLPAHGGVRIFAPLFVKFKKKYGKKIIYDVIGGWLPQLLQGKKKLQKALRAFDGIWVETSTMEKKLKEMGYSQVTVVPNCKQLERIQEADLVYPQGEPLRLCTFSRVAKDKGIAEAVNAISNAHKTLGREAFTLDIYGPIAESEKEWFAALQAEFPSYVRYEGCVDASESVGVLKEYFALLFPTRSYTEGVPGTLIDAYAAGIPVLSAKWESFSDVVEEGITGLGYDFESVDGLEKLLVMAAGQPQILTDMKRACLQKADYYRMENAVKIMKELLQ